MTPNDKDFFWEMVFYISGIVAGVAIGVWWGMALQYWIGHF